MVSISPLVFNFNVCMHTKLLQSCLTLCNSMDCSPSGSSVHGYSPCKTLEWIAMPSSRRSSQPRGQTQASLYTGSVQFSSVQSLSRVRLFATPWITARQASLSITNSRRSLRLASIKSVMPSSHLILCRPLLLLPPIPPSISLFQWVNSSHEVAKVLEFQF